jgi:DNA-binding SARP family transcriptional activator
MRPLAIAEPTRPAGAPLTIRLLEGPVVSVGTEWRVVPEGSKRLLVYLALKRGRVERVRAAGTLWPEVDDARAAGNLRSALWRLRGAGIDVLVADKFSLALHPEVAVDVHAVERWADRMIQGRCRPEDLVAVARLSEALDLLPGWYEDWVVAERDRLRQRLLHAVESLGRLRSAAGHHAGAIEAALLAIDVDPLRESAHRVLVEAHLAEGNWGEARRSFAELRRLTLCELGVEPSHALRRLVDRGCGVPLSAGSSSEEPQGLVRN